MISSQFRVGTSVCAVVGLIGLAGCSGSGASQTGSSSRDTVVVVDGGGSYHDALVKSTYGPCEKKTGITIKSTSYDYKIGTIQAQARGAKQWDIVGLGSPLKPQQASELLAPIDYNVVKQPGLPASSTLEYYLNYTYFGQVIAYRTDKYPKDAHPQTPSDLWNVKKYPGPRGIGNSPIGTLEMALIADGVAFKDLYPLDTKRAFRKLTELKQTGNLVFYTSGAEQAQQLSSGVVSMSYAWNGRVMALEKQGVPVQFTLDHGLLVSFAWSVLKTAPHKAAAMKVLNCIASPPINAADAQYFPGNVPANADAMKYFSKAELASLPNSPANKAKLSGIVSWDWWSKNFTPVYAEWQKWYAAG